MANRTRGPGWFRRVFGGRNRIRELDQERPDLVVVAECFDDAEACSSALERAENTDPAWDPEQQVVLRHRLRLPVESVQTAADIAAQDHYVLRGVGEPLDGSNGLVDLILQRVQVLDALHCSQERSRMAGLAQRHDGTVVGWDALQPARTAPNP